MSSKAEIREKILTEILNTERDYVKDLNIILDVYNNPLKESGIVTDEQAQILFANVSELEGLNRTKVLAKIQARFKAVTDAGVPSYMINMGDIFMSLSDHLKVYTEYCANQPNALAMLSELESNNSDFAAFVKSLMDSDEVVRGLSLLSFIIKPVQRLCKYPLLLRELIAHTDPNLPEHQRLKEAAQKVGETVDYVNAMQRQAEAEAEQKTKEMEQLEATIEGAAELELASDKNRRLMKSGDITRVLKKKVVPRKFYAFNNLLLLVAPKKKIKKGETQAFKLDWAVKIAYTQVIDLGNSQDGVIVNGFEVIDKSHSGPTDGKVVLCASTLQEKNLWVKEVRASIKEHQKKQNARLKNTMGGTVKRNSSRDKEEEGSSDNPPPPPEDGADWREKQANESLDPPGFVRPPRWGDWLQYHHEEHGIPYYYHIDSKEVSWFQPEGWTL
eukprot:TRINITY_DN3571_c1_g1_i1.p1 TRINITY_DN3571_c1_g1~~TRINITY_DN3571_c1_g1_i1.p1  ORF type:complete len:444 (+),score=119.87 TRINITY_DN3571_c1_g1_i1:133-1464(+)